MEIKKNLGIWMDHSTAHLIDLDIEDNRGSIHSKFDFNTRGEALSRNENLMHNKEQQMHEAYYKKIGERILNYDHVLLFGPTHAKSELHNYLAKDLHFEKIKFDIEGADKMTNNEQDAFVKNHFENL